MSNKIYNKSANGHDFDRKRFLDDGNIRGAIYNNNLKLFVTRFLSRPIYKDKQTGLTYAKNKLGLAFAYDPISGGYTKPYLIRGAVNTISNKQPKTSSDNKQPGKHGGKKTGQVLTYRNNTRTSTPTLEAAANNSYGDIGKLYTNIANYYKTGDTNNLDNNAINFLTNGQINGLKAYEFYNNAYKYKNNQFIPDDVVTENKILQPETSQVTTPVTPATPILLGAFTNDDIRNLGFHNYLSLYDVAKSGLHNDNPFMKAIYNRYGNDVSKWNQLKIESDLGVSGQYHNFGGGDFGDMSRSMNDWIRYNNTGRVGQNGTVYSNSKIRELFDAVPLNNLNTNNNLIGRGFVNWYRNNNTNKPSGNMSLFNDFTSNVMSTLPFYGFRHNYALPEKNFNNTTTNNTETNNTTTNNNLLTPQLQPQNNKEGMWDYNNKQLFKKGGNINKTKNKMEDDNELAVYPDENQLKFIDYVLNMAQDDGVTISSQDDFLNYINNKALDENMDPQKYMLALMSQILEQDNGTYDNGDQYNPEEDTEAATETLARNGAKLNYIKRLKGNCPEDSELVYYRAGGRLCKACMGKRMSKGGKTTGIERKLTPVEQFKNDRALVNANNKSAKKASKRYNINYDGKKQKMAVGGPVKKQVPNTSNLIKNLVPNLIKLPQKTNLQLYKSLLKDYRRAQTPEAKQKYRNMNSRDKLNEDLKYLNIEGDKCGGKAKIKKHYFGGKIDSIVLNDSLNRLTGRWK